MLFSWFVLFIWNFKFSIRLVAFVLRQATVESTVESFRALLKMIRELAE